MENLRQQYLESYQNRYATKQFDPSYKLSSEEIEYLKEIIRLTPTSYGLQPFSYVVVGDHPLREELRQASYNQPQVTDASHFFICCVPTEYGETDVHDFLNNIKATRVTNDEQLAPFKERLIGEFKSKPIEAVQAWATHQGYITLGNLVSACAVAGIDACPMEGINRQEIDRILNLKKQKLTAIFAFAVGKRAMDDPFAQLKKVRKSSDDLFIEIN